MFSRVIPELINLAKTSTMTSRHAAAIISGKRTLSTATNYSLPAGQLVDIAATTKSSRGGVPANAGYSTCCRSNPVCNSSTPFNRLYERYQGFECCCETSVSTREARLQQRVQGAIRSLRCEKGGTFKEANTAYWVGIGKTCRGKCFGEVSF